MKVLLSHHRDVDDNILVSLIDFFCFSKETSKCLVPNKEEKGNHFCIGCL